MNIKQLEEAFQHVWSAETSIDPDGWIKANPAWGRCAVSALLVQDEFGGSLIRGLRSNGDSAILVESYR